LYTTRICHIVIQTWVVPENVSWECQKPADARPKVEIGSVVEDYKDFVDDIEAFVAARSFFKVIPS
jgi:hypothetical protein